MISTHLVRQTGKRTKRWNRFRFPPVDGCSDSNEWWHNVLLPYENFHERNFGINNIYSKQTTIIPNPELRACRMSSFFLLLNHHFGGTSAKVATICPEVCLECPGILRKSGN